MARLSPEQTDRVNHLIAQTLNLDPNQVSLDGFTAEITPGQDTVIMTWKGIGVMSTEQFQKILDKIAVEAGEKASR